MFAVLPLMTMIATATPQESDLLVAKTEETAVLSIHNIHECAQDGDTRRLETAIRSVPGVSYASAGDRKVAEVRLALASFNDVQRAVASAGCRLNLTLSANMPSADVDYEDGYFANED